MKVINGWPLFTVLLCTAGAAVAADPPSKPATQAEQIARGRYLVAIMGCNDCHTQDFHARGDFNIPEKERLTGSNVGWRGSWGTTYPQNLRLYFSAITQSMWLGIAKEVQRRPPMHNFALNAMTESDMRDLYQYVRHLGPAGSAAPSALPPGKEPPKPYVQFPQ